MCLSSNQINVVTCFCNNIISVADKLNGFEYITNSVINELYPSTSEFILLCKKLDTMMDKIHSSEDKNELINLFNKYINFNIDFLKFGCYQNKLNTKIQTKHELLYIYDGVNINVNVNNIIKDVMLTFGTTSF